MRVSVKMFAAARDAVGSPEVSVELAEGARVADLRRELVKNYPQLSALVERTLFAIDAKYANDGDLLPMDGEIACIPPVSGG